MRKEDAELAEAVGVGDLKAARRWLGKGADPNAVDALHRAAAGDHDKIAKALIAAGARVSAPDGDGAHPLHHAAREGGKAALQVLLKAGADVNATDAQGRTPLVLAAGRAVELRVREWRSQGHIDGEPMAYEIIDGVMSCKRGDGGWVVMFAEDERLIASRHCREHLAWLEKLDQVRALLRAKARLDLADEHGVTALHHIAETGEARLWKEMVNKGAPIDAVAHDGRTVAHYAARCRRRIFPGIFSSLGDAWLAKDARGFVPLHLAAIEGVAETVHAIPRYWDQVEAELLADDPPYGAGMRPSHCADLNGHEAVAAWLREREATQARGRAMAPARRGTPLRVKRGKLLADLAEGRTVLADLPRSGALQPGRERILVLLAGHVLDGWFDATTRRLVTLESHPPEWLEKLLGAPGDDQELEVDVLAPVPEDVRAQIAAANEKAAALRRALEVDGHALECSGSWLASAGAAGLVLASESSDRGTDVRPAPRETADRLLLEAALRDAETAPVTPALAARLGETGEAMSRVTSWRAGELLVRMEGGATGVQQVAVRWEGQSCILTVMGDRVTRAFLQGAREEAVVARILSGGADVTREIPAALRAELQARLTPVLARDVDWMLREVARGMLKASGGPTTESWKIESAAGRLTWNGAPVDEAEARARLASPALTMVELASAADDPNGRNAFGTPVLVTVAQKNLVAEVQSLLAAGADPNIADSTGVTPLMSAAQMGHLDTVQVLLASGASPDLADCLGNTALHRTATTGLRSRLEVIDMLVGAGADLQARNATGRTPLLHACLEGYEDRAEVVARLLALGAQATDRDHDPGYSTLHGAAQRNRVQTAELLLRAGADPNADACGCTPLMLAAESATAMPVARMLLAAGADAEPSTGTGELAIVLAATRGLHPMVAVFLEAAASPSARARALDAARANERALVIAQLEAK